MHVHNVATEEIKNHLIWLAIVNREDYRFIVLDP